MLKRHQRWSPVSKSQALLTQLSGCVARLHHAKSAVASKRHLHNHKRFLSGERKRGLLFFIKEWPTIKNPKVIIHLANSRLHIYVTCWFFLASNPSLWNNLTKDILDETNTLPCLWLGPLAGRRWSYLAVCTLCMGEPQRLRAYREKQLITTSPGTKGQSRRKR